MNKYFEIKSSCKESRMLFIVRIIVTTITLLFRYSAKVI